MLRRWCIPLAGLGLVLTYKSSGVFNFAHGALATVSAFLFYSLFVTSNWPWPLAAVVSVLLAGPVMGLLLELLARRIQTAPLALQVASTVSLLLVIETAVALLYGTTHGLQSGSIDPQLAGNLTYMIQGLIVLFVGADVLILYIWNTRRRLRRKAEPA